MTDYISRKAAIENVIWAQENQIDEVEALECTIAADVVKVVYCKDCKYSKLSIDGETWWCGNGDRWVNEVTVLDDDFCSYGRRIGTRIKTDTIC